MTGGYGLMGEVGKVDCGKMVEESIGGGVEDVMGEVGDEKMRGGMVYERMGREEEKERMDGLIEEGVEGERKDGKKGEVKGFA